MAHTVALWMIVIANANSCFVIFSPFDGGGGGISIKFGWNWPSDAGDTVKDVNLTD